MVNRRSDTDLGNTQSAPRGGEIFFGLTRLRQQAKRAARVLPDRVSLNFS